MHHVMKTSPLITCILFVESLIYHGKYSLLYLNGPLFVVIYQMTATVFMNIG